jgi:hypothetical protein
VPHTIKRSCFGSEDPGPNNEVLVPMQDSAAVDAFKAFCTNVFTWNGENDPAQTFQQPDKEDGLFTILMLNSGMSELITQVRQTSLCFVISWEEQISIAFKHDLGAYLYLLIQMTGLPPVCNLGTYPRVLQADDCYTHFAELQSADASGESCKYSKP